MMRTNENAIEDGTGEYGQEVPSMSEVLDQSAKKYPEANWPAIFTAYAQGTAVKDIAAGFNIDVTILKERIADEGWSRLLAQWKAPLNQQLAVMGPYDPERALARIQQNRERQLEITLKLQEDLCRLVDQLVDGSLTIVRQTAKGNVVRTEPNMRDRVELANYAKTIAEMSYRALGDIGPHAEGGAQQAHQAGAITVVIPTVVAAPRSERESIDVEAKVVEAAGPWINEEKPH